MICAELSYAHQSLSDHSRTSELVGLKSLERFGSDFELAIFIGNLSPGKCDKILGSAVVDPVLRIFATRGNNIETRSGREREQLNPQLTKTEMPFGTSVY